MRRDKKAAQKKKARAVAQKKAQSMAAPTNLGAAIRLARTAPFGPAFMSPEWEEASVPPALVSVILTRALPRGLFVVQLMLVDRTCLGVKNSFVVGPYDAGELAALVAKAGTSHSGPLEEVDVAVAQSVVLHALAYAEALGFAPERDYDPTLLEPRPVALEDTPLAKRARPFYVPGPDDDVRRIIAKLDAAVGEDGYDVGQPGDAAAERDPDEAVLNDVLRVWLDDGKHVDLDSALGAYVLALTGKPWVKGTELPEEFANTLPLFWGGLFRPLEDGRIGLEHARAAERMEPYADELEQLEETRAVVFDVLGIDREKAIAHCLDVHSNERLAIRFDEHLLAHVTRWTRFFGYLTPMADGTWYPPSALLGHPWLRNSDLALVVSEANAILGELGIAERIDPAAPAAGFRRFAGIVYGVLHRSIAPTKEQLDDAAPPLDPQSLAGRPDAAERLRELELRGADGGESAFLDLDAVRRELGLAPVG